MKKLIKIIVIALVVFSSAACSKKNNPKVGDEYQGGIVFYLLKEGDQGYDAKVVHGLIASKEDQSGNIRWSLTAFRYISAPGTLETIGSGLSNTNVIVNQNGAGLEYAAGLAIAYEFEGYSDWYLPSKDELNELYKNKDLVPGLTNFGYWCSSESLADYAWIQGFSSGYVYDGQKANFNSVRAIRSF